MSPGKNRSERSPRDARVADAYRYQNQRRARQTDRMFAAVFALQWLAAILIAVLESPRTWAGDVGVTHFHVYAAIFLGGAIACGPIALILREPGRVLNRYVIAACQILFSVLLIHLTGGRIETHFHIFGSLALLAFYYEWRVLAVASAVTLADHLVRGYFWPESVYGVLNASAWRAFEHVIWVVFEDTFLFLSIRQSVRNEFILADHQISLEENAETLELRVEERTRELRDSQATVLNQQQTLIATARMSALGEMAGGVAHEINTPLAIIQMSAEQILDMAEQNFFDTQAVRESMQDILSTNRKIAKIVEGLRTFCREDGSGVFVETDLTELINETATFCSERFRRHGVELVIDPSVPGLTLEGNAVQISQALFNLLGNAFDAAKNSREKWVRVAVIDRGDEIEIQITDSGAGVPGEVREKIFQPFFTTKPIGQGPGLGLSIALGTVEQHGGTLTLDTSCRETCFVMRLPKRQGSASIAKTA